MQRTILVVDDEPKIVRLVRSYLETAGYRVLTAENGQEALERFRADRPDLIVLDLMIPGIDGLDVARAVRKHSETPIIMLTARTEESDRLVGLELGADDYVLKPFSPKELVARVRAVLRRAPAARAAGEWGAGGPEQAMITTGSITIDPVKREVQNGGAPVALTSYQFDLLLLLARQPGRVFSRMQLVEALQGEAYEGYERTVDAHMKNIRRALEDDARDPQFIQTVRGVGYRFVEQG